MKTLELKDICGYLPYGLAIKRNDEDDASALVYGSHAEIRKYEMWSPSDFYYKNMNGIYYASDFKPILRPLSDLYKTITHNGKEIVPIVECAKISIPKENWELKDECAFLEFNGMSFVFSKNEDGGFFVTTRSFPLVHLCAPNQFKLFDFLNELKIDYRNLITDGLAIDANTLENNPYK